VIPVKLPSLYLFPALFKGLGIASINRIRNISTEGLRSMDTRNMFPSEVAEERFHKIRDIVVDWYEKNCLRTEIESFDYDLSKKEGRLKIFVLGIFFNCIFQEKKARQTFSEMERHGYLEIDELDNFEANMKNVIKNLNEKTGRSWKVLKIQDMIDSVRALKEIFSKEDDVIGILREKDVEDFIKYFYEKMSGIKAKLFWICRECRDHFKISEEYCYVPDSHVISFLYNIRFLERKGVYSLEECIEISRDMAKFFSNKYFDLPFMRYHQEMCKKCEQGNESGCKIACRLNRKSDEFPKLG